MMRLDRELQRGRRRTMNVAAVTLEYIVGVDSVAGHHEGAVLLRVAVEQEAVVRGGRLLGLKHGHVALGS